MLTLFDTNLEWVNSWNVEVRMQSLTLTLSDWNLDPVKKKLNMHLVMHIRRIFWSSFPSLTVCETTAVKIVFSPQAIVEGWGVGGGEWRKGAVTESIVCNFW